MNLDTGYSLDLYDGDCFKTNGISNAELKEVYESVRYYHKLGKRTRCFTRTMPDTKQNSDFNGMVTYRRFEVCREDGHRLAIVEYVA